MNPVLSHREEFRRSRKDGVKIFISTSTFAEYDRAPLNELKKRDLEFALNPHRRKLTKDEIAAVLRKEPYSGLIAGTEELDRSVLEGAGNGLKVISRVGAGCDNVDLGAAKALGIKVYNTPLVLVDSVAELTIGLILSSLRSIPLADRAMHKGVWKKKEGYLFKDKTLGIIGLGNIGRRVAGLAEAFGAKVVFYDIKTLKVKGIRQVSLDELLKISDIVSIHSSGAEKVITKKEISQMKAGAVLVNTSRGAAVDEEALAEALRSKRIISAALDVYSQEPYSGGLTEFENAILTPHLGSYAKEARIEMEKEAVNNLIKGLREAGLL